MKLTTNQLRRIIREVVEAEMLSPEEKYNKPDIINNPYIKAVIDAKDPTELSKAKRKYDKDDKAGLDVPMAGPFFYWYDLRKGELSAIQSTASARSSGEQRADRILRMRDSAGKAIRRKSV